MTDRARLEKAVRDAATTLTAVKAAGKRLQRAKAELKELEEAERPKRRGADNHLATATPKAG
jgi:hypothetical protein